MHKLRYTITHQLKTMRWHLKLDIAWAMKYVKSIMNHLKNGKSFFNPVTNVTNKAQKEKSILLKLCVATATHNIKWVKMTRVCLIWD